ncbi:MAG: NAD(P)-binding domain-containing protein [Chloroflexi bacterium]|nr:NAD(P)-binding domain-containing protein [Chloroflexota bacterium]
MRQAERFDAVVIGGGQAGLAVGYHLAKQGRSFVILDAGARVGDAWRMRWEGLRLFTSGRLNSLPGMSFPGDPHAFPTKDDVADYLEAYATRMDLPVRTGVRVTDVWPADDGHGFRIAAGERDYQANQVVVATGAYDRPRIPDFARELDPAITQLHSSAFQSLSQLRAGPLLVVGASNSGAEIALMAAKDHRTVLSGREVGKMPFRPEDRLARVFDTFFWFFVNHVATLDTPIGRKVQSDIRDHGLPLDRIRPADLAAAGVARQYARTVGVRDGMPLLDDGQVVEVANVVWATGFRPDHTWIHSPVTGSDGWPMQTRGVVTTVPGLFFIGLPFIYAGASALLGGVGRDAAYLVEQMAAPASRMRPSDSPESATAS